MKTTPCSSQGYAGEHYFSVTEIHYQVGGRGPLHKELYKNKSNCQVVFPFSGCSIPCQPKPNLGSDLEMVFAAGLAPGVEKMCCRKWCRERG